MSHGLPRADQIPCTDTCPYSTANPHKPPCKLKNFSNQHTLQQKHSAYTGITMPLGSSYNSVTAHSREMGDFAGTNHVISKVTEFAMDWLQTIHDCLLP